MNTRHEILHPLIILGLFAFAPTFASAAAPAFPGAQGGGAASVGGRGGQVIEVTNLNDSGAGSLRACVRASGPRACVFRVGGTINLLSPLHITNSFLTIAGQTAPGGGITLSGKNMPQLLLLITDIQNVVIRYIRLRKGFNSGCVDECGSNVYINRASNLVFDHLTATWNQDEGMGGTAFKNTTFSYILMGEAVGSTAQGHHTSWAPYGRNPPITIDMTNIDFHHNLTMNNSNRNPTLRNRSSRVVNNLFYNLRLSGPRASGSTSVDLIGNKFKRGPLGGFNSEMGAFVGYPERSPPGPPSVYMQGNMGFHQANPNGDQWVMIQQISGESGGETGPMPTGWRRSTPLANTANPITAQPVANIQGTILPIVGASRRLDCNGNWVNNRDTHDTTMVNQYINNTGTSVLHRSEAGYGGFPVISGGTPCTDTDHDGMPDVWETARGLNRNNAADRNAVAASGYTNLEVYLAGTAATTTPPTTSKFVIGDRVQATASINVRGTAGGTLLYTQPKDALGTVIAGSIQRPNGVIWWRIDYDRGTDGWSGEDNLTVR